MIKLKLKMVNKEEALTIQRSNKENWEPTVEQSNKGLYDQLTSDVLTCEIMM